jgi:hypothetical protein
MKDAFTSWQAGSWPSYFPPAQNTRGDGRRDE